MDGMKELWLRIVLRLRYGDARFLRLLYWVRDPWGMEAPGESLRFEESNKQIARQFGRVDSLLEIGCGEGHQSVHLMRLCERFYGVDVSPRAIGRAKIRCGSHDSFRVGDVFSETMSGLPFVDLVVACEVLYYLVDVEAALRRMSQLGAACFVTYYAGRGDKLDHYFEHLNAAQKSTIEFEDTVWRVVWWRGAWQG